MKFYVDDVEVFELLPWHITLIENDIPTAIFESDMHRRCTYSLKAPVEKLVYVNRATFKDQLAALGVQSVPGTLEGLIEVVAARNDLGWVDLSSNVDRTIRADGVTLDPLPASYLRMAVSCLKKEEALYPQEQISWVFGEKIKGCLRRMHAEWDPKLAALALDIPLDEEAFVTLVVSQPDYLNRTARDLLPLNIGE